VTVSQERLHVTIEKHLKQGEEYRIFSYPYRRGDKEYRNVYFFDRKKGANKVTGFLVLDSEGLEVEHQIATEINKSFNQYNLLYKRFQGDWGDVVQQDMRKFVAVKGTLKN
jgi:ribosomal protein L21E